VKTSSSTRGNEIARSSSNLAFDIWLGTVSQAKGRGFESRRPLQKKALHVGCLSVETSWQDGR
jgi:hypothetical protein